MAVAGTTPVAGRPHKEGHFGVYALNQNPPEIPSAEDDESEHLWNELPPNMGSLSKEEIESLRRRGLNEMIPAEGADDGDAEVDNGKGGKVRRARGRDVVEYKGREFEDMVQDGVIQSRKGGKLRADAIDVDSSDASTTPAAEPPQQP